MAPPALEAFETLPAPQRVEVLKEAVARAHAYHVERNPAYRRTVQARGVGARLPDDLALLLRPTALTFKGYIEHTGPFPQDDPPGFVSWLSDQLSIPLPADRWPALRRRYGSLETLLSAIERLYAGLGIEIVTSSGTSGLASIVTRDAATLDLAARTFFSGIARSWGVERGTALVLVMPEETRVAMARSARFGIRLLDWGADAPVSFTVPAVATPDRIRVRAGRTFRRGVPGWLERRVLHPLMAWADAKLVAPRTVRLTLQSLRESARTGRKVLLLGGLAQLHAIACEASETLPAGSRVATGGGVKGQLPLSPAQIRAELGVAFGGAPVSDVYGMAEANWAAFECPEGRYHVPPWVMAFVTDADDRVVPGPDATGLLAFLDPIGGGGIIPPFFQTADRVRLINGGCDHDPGLTCPCGYDTAYIAGAISRVELVEEAGCAAQV